MKITLYKNCILTDNYHEVLDLTKKTRVIDGITESYSVFTDYLKALEKTEITLENMYYTRNMTFIFSFSGEKRYEEVYSYNYCKIEVEDLVRYCFITDIILCNTVVKYKTKEDIWSNYALDMNIRNAYLIQSYKLNYKNKSISFYKLPISYQSNEALNYVDIAGDTYPLPSGLPVNIVMQLQCYRLTDNNASDRQVRTVLISSFSDNLGSNTYENKGFTPKEVCDFLNKLEQDVYATKFSVAPNISKQIGTADVYIQIDNITLVPFYWGIGNAINKITDKSKLYEGHCITIKQGTLFNNKKFACINLPYLLNDISKYEYSSLMKLTEINTNNNFKLLSIGTRTSQFSIEQNGTNFYSKIFVSTDDTDFKLFLEAQGKSMEITSDFIFEVPFESLTADVYMQRKIAKNTQVYKGISSVLSGALQMARSVNSVSLNGGTIINSGVENTLPMIYTKNAVSNFEPIAEYATEKTIGAGGLAGIDYDKNLTRGSGNKIADGIVTIKNALTPQFVSNYGTFAKSNGLLNASCGGIIGCCISPDNEKIVNDFIKRVGYITYEFITDDILFNQDFVDFNILQFDYCWITGKFPAYIRTELEKILMNGFKIWYNSELKEKIENADIQ